MVDAVESILQTANANGKVFNIGNPDAVETTLGLAGRIASFVPGSVVEHVDEEHSEVKERSPVIDNAREVLSFNPKVDLDQGLEQTFSGCRAA